MDFVTYSSIALIVAGVLWWAILTGIMLREHYDVDTGDAAITIVASVIPTLILGYAVMIVWVAFMFAIDVVFFDQRFFIFE